MTDDSHPVDTDTLKFLRRLVTTLTGTMIVGLLVIIVLFVIRFSSAKPVIPDELTLPAGTEVVGYTQTPDWAAIVTRDNRILIYSTQSGEFAREIDLKTE